MKEQLQKTRETLSATDAEQGLRYLAGTFQEVRFSTALGMEDQVITHMIAAQNLSISVFTLDTGRLFQETLDLLDATRSRYKLQIDTFFPQTDAVQQLITRKGPNSFYRSVENRKECCFIRKVEPLQRALAGAQVWITGIRAEQSANRLQMELVTWDDQYEVIKYNPLLQWSLQDVEQYISLHRIPVNELHQRNFPSIGCAPCTRSVAPGEDSRSGRWWWESSAKECGLHESKILKSHT